jgi:glycosyltransferase involved in cell wall biosynthesis
VLKTLSPIKIVNMRRNFGQTAAMDAGIKMAKGRYIATLDGDGQNDPADIPKLIQKLEAEDLDVVNGWRKARMDNASKRWASRAQAWLRKKVLDDGVHDSGCSLKLYKRECFEGVHLYGEMHRFIAAILKMRGFKVGEEVVNHRPRTQGVSKYNNWKRMIKGNLDMFSVAFWQKYSARPLHVFGGLGVILMLVSVLSGLYSVYLHLRWHQDLSDSGYTYLSLFGFFIGIVLFCFGLISDMIMRSYYESTETRPYVIKEVVEK